MKNEKVCMWLEHAAIGFGQERDIEPTVLRRGGNIIETDLVAEGRLTGTGWPHHQIDPPAQETTG